MIRAQNLLGGELRDVTKSSKVYDAGDMARVIAKIDADATPATRDDTTSLAALLIGKYRMSGSPNGPIGEKDFKVYAVGLAEAFAKFPASVGLQAIDGGAGIPSKSPYWPKPFDIVYFCQDVMAKRARAKVMAQRHIAESKRRAEERRDQSSQAPIDWEHRKRRVEEIMKGFRAQTMDQAS